MNDRETIITAVVLDVRNELKLINPDLRRACRMLADGFAALIEEPQVIEPTQIRQPMPVETRVRKRKTT